ncbi:MAG: DUF4126 family protein [Armatimonadetes bacterium]|nr:DUF4126 family protein [Armatimonadota bacterium]
MTTTQANLLRALGMGAVAGMRSMTAPAILSYHAEKYHNPPLRNTPLEPLASENAPALLGMAAAGELLMDKMPFTPARTMLPSVIFRALSGAVAGAACTASEDGFERSGAVAGALAALAATYGMYHLRKNAGEATGLPDSVIALLEDALAVGTGIAALRLSR